MTPLRYLIGKDSDEGEDGYITVVGYDVSVVPKHGIGVKYTNCRDEHSSGEFAPYLTEKDDIDAQYNEPAPDPEGEGFWRNIRHQLGLARDQGFKFCEIDNLDTYSGSVALLCLNEAQERGLKVFVKNPNLVDGNRAALIRHPAAVGIIVEYDDPEDEDNDDPVTAQKLDALRREGGKPDMPIYVVSYGSQRPWAQQIAHQISAAKLPAMGVTYSSDDEYGSSDDILLPFGAQPEKPMAWRTAKSLLTLRDQVDALYPGRDKSSDGTIGDASHAATTSDHNPNSADVVTAMDITHDPAHGLDARKLAETLVASRDPRIKYIISNAQIVSSSVSPWQWRPYTGSNAHRAHVHISVSGEPSLYDDPKPWSIGGVSTVTPIPGRNMRITATRFNDSQVAYADVKPGWNSRYGVSLPYRFKGTRPKVRVFANGKSIECEIMDIGPWYDGTAARGPFDPYWETGNRPRAEIDPKTNGAGIDVTFPVDAALGLNGKGLVDWEFVGAATAPADPIPANPPATTEEAFARVEAALADLKESIRVATQPVVQQPIDWGALLAPLAKELLPKLLPTLLPYIIQLLPSLLPMILNGMTQPKQSTGLSPAATAGGAAAVGGIGGLIGALLTTFLKGN